MHSLVQELRCDRLDAEAVAIRFGRQSILRMLQRSPTVIPAYAHLPVVEVYGDVVRCNDFTWVLAQLEFFHVKRPGTEGEQRHSNDFEAEPRPIRQSDPSNIGS